MKKTLFSISSCISKRYSTGAVAGKFILATLFLAALFAQAAAAQDQLTVSGESITPASAYRNTQGVKVEWLTLSVPAGSVTITDLSFEQNGSSGNNADVEQIYIIEDADADKVIDVGETILGTGTFSSSQASITLDSPYTINSATRYWIIAYDIYRYAQSNTTMGARLLDETSFDLSSGTINSDNFPIISDTFTVLPNANWCAFEGYVYKEDGSVATSTAVFVTNMVNSQQQSITTDSSTGYYSGSFSNTYCDGGEAVKAESEYALYSGENATNTLQADTVITLNVGLDTPIANKVQFTGGSLSSSYVAPGKTGALMQWIQYEVASGSVTATGMRVDDGGTSPDSDVALVKIIDDADNDRTVDGGETVLGSSTYTSGVANITFGSPFGINTGTGTLLVVYDMSTGATIGNNVVSEIQDNSYFTLSTGTVAPQGLPIISATSTIACDDSSQCSVNYFCYVPAGMCVEDTTPPSDIATVNDGTGIDIDYSSSTTVLSANWSESSDSQNSIVGYWYSIGTTAGASDTVSWTSAGTATGVTKTGLSLTGGQMYYFSVVAQNEAELFSSPVSSDGIEAGAFSVSVVDQVNETTLDVLFTMDIDSGAGATNTANYSLDGGIGAPSGAVVQGDNQTVRLTFGSSMDMCSEYQLTISNVQSNTASTMAADPQSIDIETLNIIVTSDISVATTWEKDEGPYCVATDVTIESSSSLLIEPGTTVYFGKDVASADLGWADDAEIIVEGTLYAVGTSGDPIVFTSVSSTPAMDDWGGIRFASSTSSNNRISYAQFSYSQHGILVATTSTTISYSDFSYCGTSGACIETNETSAVILGNSFSNCAGAGRYCIYTWGGSYDYFPEIRKNQFSSTENGVLAKSSISAIFNNEFDGLTGTAINVADSYSIILDNNITNNSIGIKNTKDSSSVTATFNYFSGNTQDTDTSTCTGCSVDISYPLTNPADTVMDITSLSLKTDGTYSTDKGNYTTASSTLYIEAVGTDIDTGTVNSMGIMMDSTTSGGSLIGAQLIETGASTGIYRGTAAVGATSDQTLYRIAVSEGDTVDVKQARTNDLGDTQILINNDTTAPTSIAFVYDGHSTSSDADYWDPYNPQLAASWATSSDPETAITNYWYAIGSTSGATDVRTWTAVGTQTSYFITNIEIQHGTTYYTSVKAQNEVDLFSTTTISDGLTVDQTQPIVPAYVRDGDGTDIDYSSSTTNIAANWPAGSDPESGVASYKYSIGTTTGSSNLLAWTDTATASITSFATSGFSLSHGSKYYVNVTPVNFAGFPNQEPKTSDGVTVDTTAPTTPSYLYDGLESSDLDYATQSGKLSASWPISSEDISLINGYYYGIGTTAGATDVVSWTFSTDTSVTKTGLSLTDGQDYYFSVYSQNIVLLDSSPIDSDGVIYDSSAPVPPSTVNDGTGADISWSTVSGTLSGNWSDATDTHSGVKEYIYAIGSAAGGSNIKAWTNVGTATSVTATGLSLLEGANYYFSVKAINNAGLTSSYSSSNGQAVDTTPPSDITSVLDGPGDSDSDYSTIAGQLSASWSDSSDSTTGVDIEKYLYTIGTTSGATDVLDWTSAGTATSVTKTGLTLSDGQAYYFSVMAQNTVGLFSTSTISDGATYDSTAPSDPGYVYDGLGADSAYGNKLDRIYGNWGSSTDTHTGVSRYWFSVGTSAGASDTVSWTDNSTFTYIAQGGLTLTEGATYYVNVLSENGAGLLSSMVSSDGQLIDATVPAQSNWLPATGTLLTVASVTVTLDTAAENATCAWSLSDDSYSDMTNTCSGAGTMNHTCYATGLAEGIEYVYIACADVAGNMHTYIDNTELNYFVDTLPPDLSNISPASGSTITSSDFSITLDSSEGAICRWSTTDLGYSSIAGSQACTGGGTTSHSCALTGIADGPFSIYIACIDTYGNEDTSSTNENLQYTIDTLPPVQSAWSPTSGSIIGTATPTITLSTDESASCRWALTDAAYSTISTSNNCIETATGTHSCTASGLPEGLTSVYISCSDTHGNEDDSSTNDVLSYTVDITPPIQSVWSPSSGSTISVSTQTVTFTTNENGTCLWSSSDVAYSSMSGAYSCSAATSTSHSCTVGGMTSGTNTFYIGCIDNVGNSDSVDSNSSISYIVDLAPPIQSGWSPATGTLLTATSTVLTLNTDENATCRWGLSDDSYYVMSSSNTCSGSGGTSHSCSVSSLEHGNEYIYVSCLDSYTNSDTASTNEDLYYVVDVLPPVQSAWAPATGTYIAASTASITFTTDENATCRWALTDSSYSSMSGSNECSGTGTTSQTCAITGLSDGAVSIYTACTDANANSDTTSSNTSLDYSVDTSAPSSVASVYDGITVGVDSDEANSATELSANWDASTDAQSGIKGYWFAIGSSSGGNEVVDWTSNGASTSVTFTGLALLYQQDYYFSVKAENNAGLMSGVTISDGQTVNINDPTPPAAVSSVYDGTAADVDYWGYATYASFNWSATTDAESGIDSYWYSLGTTSGASNTVSWTSAGAATSTTLTGLSLTHGATYYLSVTARNGMGLFSTKTTSDGFTVDTSAPSGLSYVYDGSGADIDFSSSNSAASANWPAVTEPDSGLDSYYYAIGTTQGATDTVGWTSNSSSSVTASALSLTDGQTYYFSVKAVNLAGLTAGPVYSDGFVVDTTAPSAPGTVNDGIGADTDSLSSATSLSANWTSATDTVSGVTEYWYSVGTTSGASNTISWTSNATSTSFTKSDLVLANGSSYYISVKALNGAGLFSSTAISDGALLTFTDPTPPSVPSFVYDGTGADIDIASSSTSLAANWGASTDAESGVADYWYSLGTSSGASDTVSWTSSGATTSVSLTSLSLTDGVTYYFSVVAENGFSVFSSKATSDGVLVDSSAPTSITLVNDGSGADIDSFTSLTTLAANWTASSDPHSSLTAYWYAVGTTSGGNDFIDWTNAGATTSIYLTGQSITDGLTYYVSVKAQNSAGLFSVVSTSDGATANAADDTPPADIATVADGTSDPNTDLDFASSSTQLTAAWTASSDAESGVAAYWYSVGTTSGASNTVSWTDNSTATSVNHSISLTDGQMYYVNVKARNGSGLFSGITSSDGFTQDSSAPSAVSAVNDGTSTDVDIIDSTTTLSANWSSATDTHSGVAYYRYIIRETPGDSIVQDWTNTSGTSVTVNSLSLTDGKSYYISVLPVNGAGVPAASDTDSDGVTIQVPSTSLGLSIGWNLIGVPRQSAQLNPSAIFGSATKFEIIDATDFSTVTDESTVSLDTARGAWVYSEAALSSITVSGSTISSNSYTLNFTTSGWQIISNPFSASIEWSDSYIDYECSGSAETLPSIYRYYPDSATYLPLQPGGGSIYPWIGYWLKTPASDCSITFRKN